MNLTKRGMTPTPAAPARHLGLGLQRVRIIGHGEICLECGRPIWGVCERVTCATLTTHAHAGCLGMALRRLGYV